jgi:hypothetical protein
MAVLCFFKTDQGTRRSRSGFEFLVGDVYFHQPLSCTVAVSYLISVEGSNCFTMNPFSKTVSPFLTMVYGCLEVSWFSGNSRKKVTERTADEKKKAYS